MKTITYNPETHRLVPVDMLDDARVIFCSDSEPNTNGDCSDVIEWFKASIYAAPQPEPVVIGSPLTERKAQSVIDRGYKITGYTLTNEQGQKCIVDMSAVRWFDDGDKFFRMMHPQPEPVEVEPVAWMNTRYKTLYAYGDAEDGDVWMSAAFRAGELIPLYAAPPDYEAVKKQRDELVKALESFADWYDERCGDNECRPLENARAALASVKGGATSATCLHTKDQTIQTGDGTPVSYCPDCGRNEVQP